MNSKIIYDRLYIDFQLDSMKDDWSFMNFESNMIHHEFRTSYMGRVLDNTEEIKKVYTMTFPDQELIHQVFEKNESNILLFSHHAMGYHPLKNGFPFYDIATNDMIEMKKRNISLYVLHTPLDHYGQYSTSVSLSKALNMEIIEPFCQCDAIIQAGVIGKTLIKNIEEIQELLSKVVGHETKAYWYGDKVLKGEKVAIAAGGGTYPFVASEIADLGINCYITGFTKPLLYVQSTLDFHRIAKENGINVIGATHYSTEKFACMAMVKYFEKLGVKAEFMEGRYYLEDL